MKANKRYIDLRDRVEHYKYILDIYNNERKGNLEYLLSPHHFNKKYLLNIRKRFNEENKKLERINSIYRSKGFFVCRICENVIKGDNSYNICSGCECDMQHFGIDDV